MNFMEQARPKDTFLGLKIDTGLMFYDTED